MVQKQLTKEQKLNPSVRRATSEVLVSPTTKQQTDLASRGVTSIRRDEGGQLLGTKPTGREFRLGSIGIDSTTRTKAPLDDISRQFGATSFEGRDVLPGELSGAAKSQKQQFIETGRERQESGVSPTGAPTRVDEFIRGTGKQVAPRPQPQEQFGTAPTRTQPGQIKPIQRPEDKAKKEFAPQLQQAQNLVQVEEDKAFGAFKDTLFSGATESLGELNGKSGSLQVSSDPEIAALQKEFAGGAPFGLNFGGRQGDPAVKAEMEELARKKFKDSAEGKQFENQRAELEQKSKTQVDEIQTQTIQRATDIGLSQSQREIEFARFEEVEQETQDKEAREMDLKVLNTFNNKQQIANNFKRQEASLVKQREKQRRDLEKQKTERIKNARTLLAMSGRLTTDAAGNLDAESQALLDRITDDANADFNEAILGVEDNFATTLSTAQSTMDAGIMQEENDLFNFGVTLRQGQRNRRQEIEETLREQGFEIASEERAEERAIAADERKEAIKTEQESQEKRFFIPESQGGMTEVERNEFLTKKGQLAAAGRKPIAGFSADVGAGTDYPTLERSDVIAAKKTIKDEFGTKYLSQNPDTLVEFLDEMELGKTLDDIADDFRARQLSQATQNSEMYRQGFANVASGIIGKDNKKTFIDEADRRFQRGDIDGTKEFMKLNARNSGGVDQKNKIIGSEFTMKFLSDIEEDLREYEKIGGETGIFSGTKEEVARKIGKVIDPERRKIATKIQAAIQTYRRSMSGVAFSVEESKEYSSMFPNIQSELNLNVANLTALNEVMAIQLENFYTLAIGATPYNAIFKANQKEAGRRTGAGTPRITEEVFNSALKELENIFPGREITDDEIEEFVNQSDEKKNDEIIDTGIPSVLSGQTIKASPETAQKIVSAKDALQAEGIELQIADSFVPHAVKDASFKSGKKGVAPADKSFHVKGEAIDLSQEGAANMEDERVFAALRKAGFKQNPDEWWHWSIGEFNQTG